MDKDVKALQRHFDYRGKDGYQAKVYLQETDRVHLKKSRYNGTVVAVVFKSDRKYPYIKVKWDEPVLEGYLSKEYYDPFDLVKEVVRKAKSNKNQKRKVENFYLKDRGILDHSC